jgi:sterol desaturase/sphingolipid hydroxylase (fatty acid hydroxylase superfamily)
MQLIACFIFAFIFASFLEYWIHRLMHLSSMFGSKITNHYGHHRSNTTKGFFGDFLDFGLGVFLVIPAFLISLPVGIVVVLGTITFAAFAAYAHQIQHYNPTKCFWMKMPIHYVHHQNNQWDCNFGLAVDWWDRIFGTYKLVEFNSSTCL